MYHTVFTGFTVENGVSRTARLYTKGGFYELSAKVFVDASADADVATSAGVTSVYGREEDNLAPVSYTHLDVYKRQAQGNGASHQFHLFVYAQKQLHGYGRLHRAGIPL